MLHIKVGGTSDLNLPGLFWKSAVLVFQLQLLAARNYFCCKKLFSLPAQRRENTSPVGRGNYKNTGRKLMVAIQARHPSVAKVFNLRLWLPHLTAFLCVVQVSSKRTPCIARNANVYLKAISHETLKGCWGRSGWKEVDRLPVVISRSSGFDYSGPLHGK